LPVLDTVIVNVTVSPEVTIGLSTTLMIAIDGSPTAGCRAPSPGRRR